MVAPVPLAAGHEDHGNILGALEARDGARASHLLLHHIDAIEGDLDLRVREGLALREALSAS
jgi:DNA-binding GntR family transcriptional regulator